MTVAESEYLSHPLVKATDSFLRKKLAAKRADDSGPVSSVLYVSLSGGDCNGISIMTMYVSIYLL